MKTVFWDSTAKILINIIYGCIALFILSVIGLIVWARWTAGYPEPTTINNPNTVNIKAITDQLLGNNGPDEFFVLLAIFVVFAVIIIIVVQWHNPAIQVAWRHVGGTGKYHPWQPWKNR